MYYLFRKYLDNFCNYQSQKKKKLNAYWDHALLLTGQDLYSAPNMDRGSSGINVSDNHNPF